MIAPQLALTDKGRLVVLTRKLERLSAARHIPEPRCPRPIDLATQLRCTLNSERAWEREQERLTARGEDWDARRAIYFAGEIRGYADHLLDNLANVYRRVNSGCRACDSPFEQRDLVRSLEDEDGEQRYFHDYCCESARARMVEKQGGKE